MQLRINSVDSRNSQAELALHRDLQHIWPTRDSLSSNRRQDRRTRLADETSPQRDLHVGGTPLISSPELSEYFGVNHLLVKDESANPFGTHKDRKSLAVVLDAVGASIRPEALCILTAGNAGLSLARFAAVYGLSVTAFIGGGSTSSRLHSQLESACEQVIRLDLEGRIWQSGELSALAGARQGRRVDDVTNGIITPFETIVDEICELGSDQVPDVIVLPVGGGELFLGVARALQKRRLRTRLIGVTVRKDSAADKLYSKWNPFRERIAALTESGSQHRLHGLDDENLLLETFGWLKSRTVLQCEPSSAAAFALLRQNRALLKPQEKVLVINTGTFNFETNRASISR